MGVFSPGERETFERIAAALEDCADSLKKLANPSFILERPETRRRVKRSGEGSRTKIGRV